VTKCAQTVTLPELQEGLTDAFRRQVGIRKPDSICSIAAATGTKDAIWKHVQAGNKIPSLLNIMLAAQAMPHGDDFLNELLEPFGFTGARRIESRETNPLSLSGDLARAITTISEALADGKIDARKRRAIVDAIRDVSRQADGLKAVG